MCKIVLPLAISMTVLNGCDVGYKKPGVGADASCVDLDSANVLSGETFTKCDGSTETGTLISTILNCDSDGEINCAAQKQFVAADTSKFSASIIPVGIKIAGVVGTLPTTLSNCTSDGQVGCVTTSSFVAANTTAVTSYDLRKGKTFGGISGARKDCRNGMKATIYDYNSGTFGNPTGIDNAAHTNAAEGDWWNTIDNSGAGIGALPNPAAWSSNYYCDGSQITDVSNTQTWLVPSNSPLNCAATTCTNSLNFTKVLYEPYSALYLTNVLIVGSGTAQDTVGNSWDESVLGCYNLSSGDGIGKWRLPTAKELHQFAISGIYFQNAALFGGVINNSFWSATSQSGAVTSAYFISLMTSSTFTSNKTNNYSVICVR